MTREEFDKQFNKIAVEAKLLRNKWIKENAVFNIGDRITANGLVYIIKKIGWQNDTKSMIRYEVEIEGKNRLFKITEEKLIEETSGGT